MIRKPAEPNLHLIERLLSNYKVIGKDNQEAVIPECCFYPRRSYPQKRASKRGREKSHSLDSRLRGKDEEASLSFS
jgi:hypothetical protein